MNPESHLPVNKPDKENDILHETQMILLHSNGQRSDQLVDFEMVAYVSGKKSLFMVRIQTFNYFDVDNLGRFFFNCPVYFF